MDGETRLRGDTWISFLDSDFLRPPAPNGRQQCRTGFLSANDQLRIARWRQQEFGPTERAAREFLAWDDVDFEDYLQYCRDLFMQPYELQDLPLDWFARW